MITFTTEHADCVPLICRHLGVKDISSLYATCKLLKNIIDKDRDYIYQTCRHRKPHGPGEIKPDRHSGIATVSKGQYREGLKEGFWEGRYEDGSVEHRHEYRKGKKHGTFKSWHSNGVKMYELEYRNGKRCGHWRSWNEDGLLVSSSSYDDDNLHGIVESWHPNGDQGHEGRIYSRKKRRYIHVLAR